ALLASCDWTPHKRVWMPSNGIGARNVELESRTTVVTLRAHSGGQDQHTVTTFTKVGHGRGSVGIVAFVGHCFSYAGMRSRLNQPAIEISDREREALRQARLLFFIHICLCAASKGRLGRTM